ncbi:MAG TPA: response regulator [Bacteroidales bacterium]|nr:response regulator [Bacteroidales bacterium]
MKPSRILVVDDSNTNTLLLNAILTERGYQTVTALSVKEANASISKQNPDLILLDLLMPKISGFDFLQLLKSDEKTSNIPVMVVSAITDEEVIKRIMELGAVDFLKKPIDIQYLVDRVGDILIH